MGGGTPYDTLGGQYASATLDGSPVATSSPYPSITDATSSAVAGGLSGFGSGMQQAGSQASKNSVQMQDFSPMMGIGGGFTPMQPSPLPSAGDPNAIMAQLLQMIQGLGGG